MTEAPSLSKRANRAYTGLLRELQHGRFATAERLPGERDLADLLGVSRTTLRKAMAALIEEHRIEQRQGFGTFVRRAEEAGADPPSATLPWLTGFDTPGAELLRNGEARDGREVTTGLFLANPEETFLLDLQPDRQVTRRKLEWVGSQDIWLAHESVTWVGADPPSIRRRLRRMRSATAGDTPAGQVKSNKNTIGILIEERGFSADGRCLALARLWRPVAGLDVVYSIETTPPAQS